MDLTRLFSPASVAVVGASADAAKLSSQPLRILLDSGFPGRLMVVNPGRHEVAGVPAVPRATDLPEAPDVGIVAVPAPYVPDVVADLAARGTRHVIVLSAGFNETAGGREHADRLAAVVRDTGMLLVGPNSEGVWSLPGRALMTHGSAAMGRELVDGPIAVLSQSGSIGAAMGRTLLDRGSGLRYLVSLGNELGVTMADCLEHVVAEDQTAVVLLFIEGLRDGDRLPGLLRRARAQGITVVATKAGVSPRGQDAVATHTGKLATPGRVYEDVFRACGHVVTASVTEAVRAAEVLAANRGWAPRAAPGRGLGLVSASGGSRALLVDEAWRHGLPIATFSAGTIDAVRRAMRDRGVPDNPVDVDVGALYDAPRFCGILATVAGDPAVDAVVVQFANRGARQLVELEPKLLRLRATTGTPLVVSLLVDRIAPELERRLTAGGVTVASDPTDAIRRVLVLYGRGGDGGSAPAPAPAPAGTTATAPAPPDAPPVPPRPWEDHAELVERIGIPLAPWRVAHTADDLREAVRALTPPLVLKALPEHADHKTERGLVRVGLRTTDEITRAFDELRAILGGDAPLLVQRMVPDGVELLLAVRTDPDLGPVLALGSGGVGVELDDDVAYLPADATLPEVHAALGGLRVHRRLAGFRGQPPGDVAALADAARALGQAFLRDGHGTEEIEINPLFVLPAGSGVMAADVRMRWAAVR